MSLTEDKDEEEKEKFYDELEKAYDECPQGVMLNLYYAISN
jgi:hypothetical protein